MHGRSLCALVNFAMHACWVAVRVSVCMCVSMGTQWGARGASQGKWVFVKKRDQIGTPNIPPGRGDRSILARSLYTHTHTYTHIAWCTTPVLLLRSHSENRELCYAIHILNRAKRETSGSVGIDFCPSMRDNSSCKRGITGLYTTFLSSEKKKLRNTNTHTHKETHTQTHANTKTK